MKGVVLAAGDGGRLRLLTQSMPKVLLEMGRRLLIDYPLEALRATGITDIAVVVGYRSHKIRDALRQTHPHLTYVYNEHYMGGNALSLYAARSFVRREPFVVCMGDHPISAALVDRLVVGSWDGCVLCVDATARYPSQINDATRVWLDDRGYVSEIGKELTVWNAMDTGVFQMTRDVFPAVEHLMHRRGHEVSITEVVRLMGALGHPFATCDVSGAFWADVDTPEDYESVAGLLREKYGERV